LAPCTVGPFMHFFLFTSLSGAQCTGAGLDVCGSIASTPPCSSSTFRRFYSMVFANSSFRCVFFVWFCNSDGRSFAIGSGVRARPRAIHTSSLGNPLRSNTWVTACGAVDEHAHRVGARWSKRIRSTTRTRYFRVSSFRSDHTSLEPNPSVGTNRSSPQPIGSKTCVKANGRTTTNHIRPSNQREELQRT